MCWREDRADNMRDGGRWSRRPPPTRGEVITLTNCPGRTPPEGAGEHPPCLSKTERLWNNVQGRLGAPARPAPRGKDRMYLAFWPCVWYSVYGISSVQVHTSAPD